MRKLDDIIKGHINEREENSTHAYARLLRIAVDGLKDLHMDVSGVAKVIKLTIDTSTYTANIPKDFIAENRVSVCIGERLYPLMMDNDICLNRDTTDCGAPEHYDDYPYPRNQGYVAGQFYQNSNWRVGEFIGRQYGAGAGVSRWGRYRFDKANGWIQFQFLCHFDHVVMEYLANPQLINGEYFVHEYDVEALNSFIYWASIRSKTTIGGGEKQRAAMEYSRLKNVATQRHNAPTLDELYQAIRTTFKLAPKI